MLADLLTPNKKEDTAATNLLIRFYYTEISVVSVSLSPIQRERERETKKVVLSHSISQCFFFDMVQKRRVTEEERGERLKFD